MRLVAGSNPATRTTNHHITGEKMGYHDRDTFEKNWSRNTSLDKNENRNSNPPRVQIISPQKQLFDIQQVLNNISEQSVMTAQDLKVSIQRILDGEA